MSDSSATDDEGWDLYPVWHFCAHFEDELEYSMEKEDGQYPRCIGVFSSYERAAQAVEHCRLQPGFRDWPNSFRIFHDDLDFMYWETGFITGWDDDE